MANPSRHQKTLHLAFPSSMHYPEATLPPENEVRKEDCNLPIKAQNNTRVRMMYMTITWKKSDRKVTYRKGR